MALLQASEQPLFGHPVIPYQVLPQPRVSFAILEGKFHSRCFLGARLPRGLARRDWVLRGRAIYICPRSPGSLQGSEETFMGACTLDDAFYNACVTTVRLALSETAALGCRARARLEAHT